MTIVDDNKLSHSSNMPGVNWIPGLSQAKSFCQLVSGDSQGARRTQQDFLQQCPGVSQVTSAVQIVAGDGEGALETQKRCFRNMGDVANGVPVVGHVKGVVHGLCGDDKGASRAYNSANRSMVVLGSGIVGVVSGATGIRSDSMSERNSQETETRACLADSQDYTEQSTAVKVKTPPRSY